MDPLQERIAKLSPEKRRLLERRLTASAVRPAPITIPPAPPGPVPATFAQQRLWFLERWVPGRSLYHNAHLLHWERPIEPDVLRRCLAALVKRHDSLRAGFQDSDSGLLFRVADAVDFELPVVQLSGGAGPPSPERQLFELARTVAQPPFDLSRAPLWRVSLARWPDGRCTLVWVFHHIISDRWSLNLLASELLAQYETEAAGHPSEPPPSAIGYRDYAAWQRSLDGPALRPHLDYWRQQLEGVPTELELPSDRPRPATMTGQGACVVYRLDTPLVERLQALAGAHGATLYMVLLSAWATLLRRYTRQDRFIIGVPVAGRAHRELEPVVGLFVNTLALPLDLSGDPPFVQLLSRVRERLLEAQEHQDAPFERVLEELRLPREAHRPPLVQILFNAHNLPRLGPGGCAVRIQDVPLGVSRLDLTVTFKPRDRDAELEIEYSSELFDRAFIDRLLSHFDVLLRGAAAQPHEAACRLPILPPAERAQVLKGFNPPATPPQPPLVVAEFWRHVSASPLAPAVLAGDRTITYGQLGHQVRQFSAWLQAQGVEAGSRVALCLEPGLEVPGAILGILNLGATYVPLGPDDPPQRHAALLQQTLPRAVLTQRHLRQRLGDADLPLLCIDDPSCGDLPAPPAIGHDVAPHDPAYILFTSGSTGTPKGVVMGHAALAYHTAWFLDVCRMRPGDRLLYHTRLTFDISVAELFAPLACGAAIVVCPAPVKLDPPLFVRLLADQRVTHLLTSPPFLRELIEEPRLAECANLRFVTSGAEVLPPELVQRFHAACRAELFNYYGPTECCVGVTLWHCRRGVPCDTRVPIGRPAPHARFYILDEHLQPQPIGVPGELYIGGPSLAISYLDPDQTRRSFLPDPFNPSQRLYRSGDLCRWRPDGTVDFLGRLDHQIKLRGLRIEPGEIQWHLAQHPAIAQSLVTADGEGRRQELVAYLLLRDPQTVPTPQEWRRFLETRLPPHMLPSRYVPLSRWPTTAHGKTDRKALAALSRPTTAPDTAYQPPRNEWERQLADLWAKVLGVPRVGIHDNFFDLGGHSLKALTLVKHVQKQTGRDITVRDLFLHPTIADLAASVGAQSTSPVTPPPAGRKDCSEAESPDNSAAPSSSAIASPAPLVDPSGGSPALLRLADIWAEVLGHRQFRPDDSFFDVGGHSLAALVVVARMRAFWSTALTVQELFATPTLSGMAQRLGPPDLEAPTDAAAPAPARESAQSSAADRAGLELADQVPPGSELLPLMPPQERLWFLEQLQMSGAAYNVPLAFRLRGPLDAQRLQQCLAALVQRHEVLRASFRNVHGRPVQVIEPQIAWQQNIVDLTSLPVEERWPRAQQLIQDDIRRPFDLTTAPLFRFTLLRLDERDHVWLWNLHHIVVDEWTLRLLVAEASRIYAGESPAGLEPVAGLYGQVVRAAVDDQARARWRTQLEYWRTQLSGAPVDLDLPADFSRPPRPSSRGGRVSFKIPADLAVTFKSLAQSHSASLFMTYLALFEALLFRLTQQEDFLVGTPMTGRMTIAAQKVAGFFLNTLALRANLAGHPSFTELLQRTRGVSLDAFVNWEAPFHHVVNALGAQRAGRRAPLVQAVFVLLTDPDPLPQLPNVHAEIVALDSGTAKFDLTLFLRQQPDGSMAGAIEYAADLFERASVERIAEQFVQLARSVSAAPQTPLDQLQMLGSAERVRILETFHGPQRPLPAAGVHALFAQQVRQRGEATALICADRKVSYARLESQANQLARYLMARGVKRGDRVAVAMDRSIELVLACLAVLKAGAAYVPLDLSYPDERLRYMLADSMAPCLLAQPGWTPPPTDVPCLPMDVALAGSAKFSDAPPEIEGSPDDLAYVMFTSGSTGKPKGVMVPHRGIVRLLIGTDYVDFGPHQRHLFLAPPTFDASTFEVWAPLLHGGVCAIHSARIPSLEDLESILRRYETSCLWLTAALFNTVIDHRPQALATVRHVLTGGEALSVPHVRRALDALPDTRLTNGYGPTECTTFTCTYDIPRDLPATARSVPIGRPIANTRAYVLDPHGQPVAPGVMGELYVGGPGVALGYLNQPQLTAERFVPDPFHGGSPGRLYRTGDLVRWRSDGLLDFLGRRDHQVKIRGHRIELGEIEAALAELPGIRQCAVVARGEGAARTLVGYYAPASLAMNEVRRLLSERLPGYMVPDRFVSMAALPLSPNGKIDRQALPEAAPPAPDRHDQPATATERALAAIWAEILGSESIGRHDDFFELGGTSLAAVRVLAEVEKRLGSSLSIAALFQAPTLEQLARLIDHRDQPEMDPTLVPIRADGSRPPLFLVHGIGGTALSYPQLAARLDREQPLWGLQARGVDGRQPIQDDITEMARTYVQAVRRRQPHGPYFLAGYSLGGIIAYEMGRQLKQAGETVAFVGIIDTIPPNTGLDGAVGLRWLLYKPAQLFWRGVELLRRGPVSLARAAGRRVRLAALRLSRWRAGQGDAGSAIPAEEFVPMDGWPAHLRRIAEVHWQAWHRHRPLPYDGTLDLFRLRSRRVLPEENWGWGKLTGGRVRVWDITGSHTGIFEEPHVQRLVDRLQTAMRRALAESGLSAGDDRA